MNVAITGILLLSDTPLRPKGILYTRYLHTRKILITINNREGNILKRILVALAYSRRRVNINNTQRNVSVRLRRFTLSFIIILSIA